jgi:2,3-bisphosphoglycerate-dependent phosphoglycerate mutase
MLRSYVDRHPATVVQVTTLLLVRHGETDWNLERRVQGHTDRPLNATGLEQARALAEQLTGEPLDAVYASDLVRARHTAAIVAREHGLGVTLEAGLREKHFGSWEGLTDVEIEEKFPDAVHGRWGDGETTEAVAARAIAAIERIRAFHPDGTVLLVSHGGPMRAILEHLAVPHGPIANGALIRVVVER